MKFINERNESFITVAFTLPLPYNCKYINLVISKDILYRIQLEQATPTIQVSRSDYS